MKNFYGLLLALGLGAAGGLFNWAYLSQHAPTVKTESFVGIDPKVDIERGQKIKESQLVEVRVPESQVGNLRQFAIPWASRGGAKEWVAPRLLKGGSLLLEQDLRTPPQQVNQTNPNERVVWMPVDTRTFVPSLVMPGDLVWFVVSKGYVPPASIAADDPSAGPAPRPAPLAGKVETVGPFKVKSLGNRLGSATVMRTDKVAQLQENILGISVTVDAQGNLPTDIAHLLELLTQNNFQPLGVMWQSQQARE